MSSPTKKTGESRFGPSDGDRVAAAVEMHQQGRIDEAARVYREVLRHSPDDVDALNFLGVAEHQLGNQQSALEHLGRAVKLAPNHPDALGNRGNVFKRLGRLDEAEADYRRALQLRPKDPNTLNNLGTILRERGKLEDAVAMFRETVSLAPNHAASWQNLGNALAGLGRAGEAIEAHRKAVQLAPQSAKAHDYLAAVLAANGHLAEAEEVYKRWLEIFPDDPRAQHLFAACTGQSASGRASDDYVRAEFAGFAAEFDRKLAKLEYRAPDLVAGELGRRLGTTQKAAVILDAGCGTGLCAPLVRSRAGRLIGVDLSAEMVELARKRELYDLLIVEELTAYLRRQEKANDIVISADTLVYFGDLDQVITAAAQSLRDRGILIFTVERTTGNDAPSGYRIAPSGRYQHSPGYVLAVLGRAGFEAPSVEEVALRKEAGRWVDGLLVGGCLARNG